MAVDPWPEGLYECFHSTGNHWEWYYYEDGSLYLCDRSGNNRVKEYFKTPLERQQCSGRMILRQRKHPLTPEEIQE